MNLEGIHKPVLLKEVLYYLNLNKGNVIFDGTLGGAGHTVEIIKAIAPTGRVIGVDLHSQAISTAAIKLKEFSDRVILVNDNFANVKEILKRLNIKEIDGMLLDLGLSSFLIEKSERGFSYLRNEKLDMRFGDEGKLDAYYVINKYPEARLAEIFRQYGEERWSKYIARNIVNHRISRDINTTEELVEIVRASVPYKYRYKRGGHPAKRIFQAIRIEVNKEIDNLIKAIEDGFEVLKSGGRMVIISYHSIEDRVVKRKFQEYGGVDMHTHYIPDYECVSQKKARIITKKVVKPSEEEIELNPRSSSGKLRVIEKI
jgi:16S rRNA (cytosine1402-N4)-methyltransferase